MKDVLLQNGTEGVNVLFLFPELKTAKGGEVGLHIT